MINRLLLLISICCASTFATDATYNEQFLQEKTQEIITHVFKPLTLEQQQPIAQWAKQSYQLSLLECTMRTITKNLVQAALIVKDHKQTSPEQIEQAVKQLTHNLTLFAKCKPMYEQMLTQWTAHAHSLEQCTDESVTNALGTLVEFVKFAVSAYANTQEEYIQEQLELLQGTARSTANAQQLVQNTIAAVLEHKYPFELPEEQHVLAQLDTCLSLGQNSSATHVKALQELVAIEEMELHLITFTTAVFDGYCKAIFKEEVETNEPEHTVHN